MSGDGPDAGRREAALRDVALLRSFGVLNRTFLAYFSRGLAGEGLSYSEGTVLMNVAARPGAMQDALARELVIDKAAVARSVKGLKAKELVQVRRSPTDRRAHELRLTPDGQALVARIARWNEAWIGAVTDGIDAEAWAVFRDVLTQLVARSKEAPVDVEGRGKA
ncbi:MAG: winged helix-turn-helix transcriptional regulator [Alphaproteobacteria bacterium]|nr:winged helix-turn-helix transcriptional regulator [Alphaproteobacteria bacterium]